MSATALLLLFSQDCNSYHFQVLFFYLTKILFQYLIKLFINIIVVILLDVFHHLSWILSFSDLYLAAFFLLAVHVRFSLDKGSFVYFKEAASCFLFINFIRLTFIMFFYLKFFMFSVLSKFLNFFLFSEHLHIPAAIFN